MNYKNGKAWKDFQEDRTVEFNQSKRLETELKSKDSTIEVDWADSDNSRKLNYDICISKGSKKLYIELESIKSASNEFEKQGIKGVHWPHRIAARKVPKLLGQDEGILFHPVDSNSPYFTFISSDSLRNGIMTRTITNDNYKGPASIVHEVDKHKMYEQEKNGTVIINSYDKLTDYIIKKLNEDL